MKPCSRSRTRDSDISRNIGNTHRCKQNGNAYQFLSLMQASLLRLLQHYYNSCCHLFICCKCYYGCIIASLTDNVVIACSFLIDFNKSTFPCVMQLLSEKYEQTLASREGKASRCTHWVRSKGMRRCRHPGDAHGCGTRAHASHPPHTRPASQHSPGAQRESRRPRLGMAAIAHATPHTAIAIA